MEAEENFSWNKLNPQSQRNALLNVNQLLSHAIVVENSKLNNPTKIYILKLLRTISNELHKLPKFTDDDY